MDEIPVQDVIVESEPPADPSTVEDPPIEGEDPPEPPEPPKIDPPLEDPETNTEVSPGPSTDKRYGLVRMFEADGTQWVARLDGMIVFESPGASDGELQINTLDGKDACVFDAKAISDHRRQSPLAISYVSDRDIQHAFTFHVERDCDRLWNFIVKVRADNHSPKDSPSADKSRCMIADPGVDFPLFHQQFKEVYLAATSDDILDILAMLTSKRTLDGMWKSLEESITNRTLAIASQIADVVVTIITLYARSLNPFVGDAFITGGTIYRGDGDPLMVLLNEENFPNVVKAMEYEASIMKHNVPLNHFEFMTHYVNFREVVSIKNERFNEVCHFIYRLLYLRDACLPRHFDEIILQRLNVVVSHGYSFLCRTIVDSPQVFHNLKRQIPSDVLSAHFLNNLLIILKTPMPGVIERSHVLLKLQESDILTSLDTYLDETDAPNEPDYDLGPSFPGRPLVHETNKLSLAIDILYKVAELCPTTVRITLANDSKNNNDVPAFWLKLAAIFQKTDNEGLAAQVVDIFKHVLSMELNSSERTDVLDPFYSFGVIDSLLKTVIDADSTATSYAKSQICGILSTCVCFHEHRIRYSIMKSNFPLAVVDLSKTDKQLALHCVKFFKTCLATGIEFFIRYIVRNDITGKLLSLLRGLVLSKSKSYAGGGVLESAILQLLYIISSKGYKTVITSMYRLHPKLLSTFREHYRKTSKGMKLFDVLQSQNSQLVVDRPKPESRMPLNGAVAKAHLRAKEAEEDEAYFDKEEDDEDEDEEEEETAISPPLSTMTLPVCATRGAESDEFLEIDEEADAPKRSAIKISIKSAGIVPEEGGSPQSGKRRKVSSE